MGTADNITLPVPDVREATHTFSTIEEVNALAALVRSELDHDVYDRRAMVGIALAVLEGGMNAVKHAHGYDPSLTATLSFQISRDQCCIEIEDQGPGFDMDAVPDPTADEAALNLPSGRGLLLIKNYMTHVTYKGRKLIMTMIVGRNRSSSCASDAANSHG